MKKGSFIGSGTKEGSAIGSGTTTESAADSRPGTGPASSLIRPMGKGGRW